MGDNWNMENLIVLTPAWSSMKEAQKGSHICVLINKVTQPIWVALFVYLLYT